MRVGGRKRCVGKCRRVVLNDRGRGRWDRGGGKYTAAILPSKVVGQGIDNGVGWGVRMMDDHYINVSGFRSPVWAHSNLNGWASL